MMIGRHVMFAGAAFLAASFSGAASAGQVSEVGYNPGALGVSAIMQGDYETAVTQLNRLDGTTRGNPARLINLANAYAGMGRFQEARKILHAVRRAEPVELTLADGSFQSSHQIARTALDRIPRSYASR